ncbi:MAG: hypothetical protein R3298_01475 [Gammaproteobacteria bacterium]|nr:hypothetical protein [Gammaproteobacteria bacterium]
MPEPPYTIDPETIQAAGRCHYAYRCLEQGPKCKAVEPINRENALLIRCNTVGWCSYKTGIYLRGGDRVSVCSCPIRLEFFDRHGI